MDIIPTQTARGKEREREFELFKSELEVAVQRGFQIQAYVSPSPGGLTLS